MKQIQQAFTLVELIVVVTILAILATIGFVSYSGYLTGVRDTNRVASLTAISDGLELYRTKNDLPLPDNNVEVQVESETIARQGYAGSNVLQTIEYSKAGKDPKDDQYYSYYLTDDKKHYQMMAFLEESDNLETRNHPAQPHPNPLLRGEGIAQNKNKTIESNVLLPSPLRRGVGGEVIFGGVTFAATDYSNRHPKVYGKRLGILTDEDNTPIQEISAIKTVGHLNMTGGTSISYKVYYTDANTFTGSGTSLIANASDDSSCKRIKEIKGSSKDGIYTINPTGTNNINVYCDMTTDGGGWTMVANISSKYISIDSNTYTNGLGSMNVSDRTDGDWILDVDEYYTIGKTLKVEMGEINDYFRPTASNNLRDMILSYSKHLWSADFEGIFIAPAYFSSHFGGSAVEWPSINAPNDNRRYLSFWGGSANSSGCCFAKVTDTSSWYRTFKLWVK